MAHARIGRVTMKDDRVVSIRRGAPILSDRKADFIAHAGSAYDSYVRKHGEEPEAQVLVLGGLKQTSEAFWETRGESRGGSTTMLAFAAATLSREIAS